MAIQKGKNRSKKSEIQSPLKKTTLPPWKWTWFSFNTKPKPICTFDFLEWPIPSEPKCNVEETRNKKDPFRLPEGRKGIEISHKGWPRRDPGRQEGGLELSQLRCIMLEFKERPRGNQGWTVPKSRPGPDRGLRPFRLRHTIDILQRTTALCKIS